MSVSPLKRQTMRRKAPSFGRRTRSRDQRSLLFETLESRHLLTSVVDVTPAPNSHTGPTLADVSATFDGPISGATGTVDSFAVHASMHAAPVTVHASPQGLTADPIGPLFPGELVQATITSEVEDIANRPVDAHVWQFRVATNAGSGVFAASGQSLGRAQSVTLGDLDADGDLDAIFGSQIWRNQGNGTFSDSGQVLGGFYREMSLGDVDGDGDLDVFGVSSTGEEANRVWLNDGSGEFTDSGQRLGNHDSFGLALGDLDGDGDLDAFVSNRFQQGNRIWLNTGGQFVDSGQSLGAGASRDAFLGDLDNDGDLDAFVANDGPNLVWLNDGTGTFANSGQTLGNHYSNGVSMGDLDGDGDLDAFVVGGRANRVWLNDGNGGFNSSNQLIGDHISSSVSLGDLDGDGDLDGFVTNSQYQTNRVWLNNGSAQFVDAGQTFGTVSTYGGALGDVDRDGDLDVVVANQFVPSQVWTNINLKPSLSLSVDSATIPEAARAALVTATLSAAHTEPVTVNLAVSGSATENVDFTVSGTQIVVPPGATSGSVTVAAVQDSVDELDETVELSVSSVTNGQGTGSVAITIVDDDEPAPVPDVTLAVDNVGIPEEGGVATFTATLSEVTTVPVTVQFAISGAAGAEDYVVSATEVVIQAGQTAGSITVTATQDEVEEPDESVVVDISSVVGGNEAGTQRAETLIVDGDQPVGLMVTVLTPTSTGFIVEFTNELNAVDLNLFDTRAAAMGAADVVLTGASNGPISGSMVVNDGGRSVQFIKSGGPLEPDTYTVRLRSAADGFEDTSGLLLDGNGDGTGGDDFLSSFTVNEPAPNQITIGIPDVVRGPGQDVNLPADSTAGIPLTISNGDNVRAIDLRIRYDPTLLTITGAMAGPDALGATAVLNTSTPGLAILVFFGSNSLPAGESIFVKLQATVPTEDAGEIYGRQQVLDVHNVVVGDGNDNEFPVTVDDALHVTTYFADVSGNGRINASDAAQVARVAALLDSGFGATLLTDPRIVGDISGNGRLNAADASLVARQAALIDVPEIPDIPAGAVGAGSPGLALPDFRVAVVDSVRAEPVTVGGDSAAFQASGLIPPAVDQAMIELDRIMAEAQIRVSLEEAIQELFAAADLPDS